MAVGALGGALKLAFGQAAISAIASFWVSISTGAFEFIGGAGAAALGWPLLLGLAIGAAAVVIATHWDAIATGVGPMWERIKSDFSAGAASAGAIFSTFAESIRQSGETLGTLLGQAIQNGLQALNDVWNWIAQGFQNAFNAAASAAQSALATIGSYIEEAIAKVQSLIDRLVQASGVAAGSDLSGGSGNSGYATGGFVTGPGTGTSDSIPAWLSHGEFVVRAAAVSHWGVDLFRALNSMRLTTPRISLGLPAFADGGLVGAVAAAGQGQGRTGQSFTLNIDGKSFPGLTGSPDTLQRLQDYAALKQMSATAKRPPSRIG